MEIALVIDNDVMNRNIINKMLSEYFNYKTISMEASEALNKKLNETIPSIIFLGITMPAKQGIEILEVIRAEEKTKETPVVVMSALSDRGTLQKLIELGITDIVVKPFERNATYGKLRQIIAKLREMEGKPVLSDAHVADKKKGFSPQQLIAFFQNHVRGDVNQSIYTALREHAKDQIKIVKLKTGNSVSGDYVIKVNLLEAKKDTPVTIAILGTQKGVRGLISKVQGSVPLEIDTAGEKIYSELMTKVVNEMAIAFKKRNVVFKFENILVERQQAEMSEDEWHFTSFFITEGTDIFGLGINVKVNK